MDELQDIRARLAQQLRQYPLDEVADTNEVDSLLKKHFSDMNIGILTSGSITDNDDMQMQLDDEIQMDMSYRDYDDIIVDAKRAKRLNDLKAQNRYQSFYLKMGQEDS